MGARESKGRREFLRGVAAAPLLAAAGLDQPRRARPGQADRSLTIIFAGLCAFIDPKGGPLTVVFPDTHEPGYRRAPHRATLAHLRQDVYGVVRYSPTTVALDYVELSLEGASTNAKLTFNPTGLVDMRNVVEVGRIHPESLHHARDVQARVVIDPTKIGTDLTLYESAAEEAVLTDGSTQGTTYAITVSDELTLSGTFAAGDTTTVSIKGRHLDSSNDSEWFPVFDKSDKSAVLLFMNLPTSQPYSSAEREDHHFRKYYDLANRQPDRQLIPVFTKNRPPGRGGGLPRCAMALFQP